MPSVCRSWFNRRRISETILTLAGAKIYMGKAYVCIWWHHLLTYGQDLGLVRSEMIRCIIWCNLFADPTSNDDGISETILTLAGTKAYVCIWWRHLLTYWQVPGLERSQMIRCIVLCNLFADPTSHDDGISETILTLAGAKIYMGKAYVCIWWRNLFTYWQGLGLERSKMIRCIVWCNLFADPTSNDDGISETILTLAGAKIYMGKAYVCI